MDLPKTAYDQCEIKSVIFYNGKKVIFNALSMDISVEGRRLTGPFTDFTDWNRELWAMAQ